MLLILLQRAPVQVAPPTPITSHGDGRVTIVTIGSATATTVSAAATATLTTLSTAVTAAVVASGIGKADVV